MPAKITAADQLPLTSGKTKRCHRCKEAKPLDAFAVCRSRKDGLQGRCRPCQAEAHQEWLARHPEKRAERSARQKRHYRENPDYYSQKAEEFKARNPTYKRDYYLANREKFIARRRVLTIKQKYGLSVEEYEAILARGCAICGAMAGTARLNMDHDHATGSIRDALCQNCNAGIGHLKDDPKRLRDAADYLERHGK